MATQTLPHPKSKRLWTYDELLAEMSESNQPCELWDGKLITLPAPSPGHQDIVLTFARLLDAFVRPRKLGKVFVSPLDIVLTPTRAVQPDIVFISHANRKIIQDRIRGVPDLVVEVISEGSWRRDRLDKRALYEQFGLAEYWIVDPESKTIEVFTLVKGAYKLQCKSVGREKADSKLLQGLKISFEDFERE